MPDDRAGPYTLIQRIGIGGMAEVFIAARAGASDAEPRVVVKRLLPQMLRDADAVSMFNDEARLEGILSHPNVVAVVDHGEDAGARYIVLEHMDGVDAGVLMENAQKRYVRVPPHLAAFVVREAARGLGYAHRAKAPDTGRPLRIVHRDVSPSNILVAKDGRVKVADFGIARSALQTTRTATGVLKGKLPYMAPEQLLAGPVDSRVDIYALGCVLWELCTGRRIHGSRTDLAILKAIQDREVPRLPSSIATRVPPRLDELTLRCLSHDAAARPADGVELAAALDEILAAEQQVADGAALAAWIDKEQLLAAPAAADPEVTPTRIAKPRGTPSGRAAATPIAAQAPVPPAGGPGGPVSSAPLPSGPIASGPAPKMTVRGTALLSVLRAVEKLHGADARARVIDALPEPVRTTLRGAVLGMNDYSIAMPAALHQAIHDVFGGLPANQAVGRQAALDDFTGVYRVFMAVMTLDFAWNNLEKAWTRYNSQGTLRFAERTPRSASAIIDGVDGYTLPMWNAIAGRFRGVLELVGAKNPLGLVVSHSDTAARIDFTWSR